MARCAKVGVVSTPHHRLGVGGEERDLIGLQGPEQQLSQHVVMLTHEVRAVLGRITVTRAAVAELVSAYEAIVDADEHCAEQHGPQPDWR